MAIETADIEHVARLARIGMTPSEVADLQTRLSKILHLVDQLQAVDTSGVEPLSHPLDAVQRLRADAVTETNQREAFLAIAPATEDGLYLVPKVIDQVE
ncbi:MAG: Asp-tRNA(Asn)/Glu-tRNA(Gln) amidotransferase subunit GatC [Spongiibacteraceae bacterium]|jgi:aspartyl-tRNA(Asn)/glutamyl-tRNA(Gln) amidotransferase subunit C|nr:Asp-tRNA(Asn)/Glu-tRNA(Gln) amidotransferase subunit GatC [Spongiibacteraceae bacterium]